MMEALNVFKAVLSFPNSVVIIGDINFSVVMCSDKAVPSILPTIYPFSRIQGRNLVAAHTRAVAHPPLAPPLLAMPRCARRRDYVSVRLPTNF
jgi:hypothetical protein